jgi:hypothetical protein
MLTVFGLESGFRSEQLIIILTHVDVTHRWPRVADTYSMRAFPLLSAWNLGPSQPHIAGEAASSSEDTKEVTHALTIR